MELTHNINNFYLNFSIIIIEFQNLMNLNDKQKKQTINYFYSSTNIFHKNQIKRKSLGNTQQASFKNLSNYNQTSYIPKQKSHKQNQLLKKFLIQNKKNKSPPRKQLSLRYVKTSLKVQKPSLSPIKRKKSNSGQNNLVLQRFSPKSQAKKINKGLDRPNKMFESEVSTYNQSNIYNLLKKIKTHKDQMNRKQFQTQQKEKEDNTNTDYLPFNNINKDYLPFSFIDQKNIQFNQHQTQAKRLQIDRIQAKLMNKQIQTKLMSKQRNTKNVTLTETQIQTSPQFINKESPINNIYKIKSSPLKNKNNNFNFLNSYSQLKQFLIRYSQISKQGIFQIEQQIKRQQGKREQTIQIYASKLKQTIFSIIQVHVQNWKQSQKHTMKKIGQTNILSIQQLKDQLFQKDIFLESCISKLQNTQNQFLQINYKNFQIQNLKHYQNIKEVYKNIFAKTLGSEVDKYIDQITHKIKIDLEHLKSIQQTTNSIFSISLAQEIQNQLNNFQSLCHKINKQKNKNQFNLQILPQQNSYQMPSNNL